MKKIIFLALLLMSQMTSLKALDVEARVAYFLPEDSRMRHIYSRKGFVEYELEVANPLCCLCECAPEWDAFANLAFYQKHGRSSCLNNRTKVTNWTLNFGVKRYFDFCFCPSLRPYLGFGAGPVNVRFHDQSDYVKRHTHKWGVGILAKSGVRYDLNCNFYVDFFADYSYAWFNFKHRKSCVAVRNVNTGGLKLGIGLGYQF